MDECPKCRGREFRRDGAQFNMEVMWDGVRCYLWFPRIEAPVCVACGNALANDEARAYMTAGIESLRQPQLTMTQFAIFDHPDDYPDRWVISKKIIGRGVVLNTPEGTQFSDSLEGCRKLIPAGCLHMPRFQVDILHYVESWMIPTVKLKPA